MLRARKSTILISTVALVLAATVADWVMGHNISLAALYILPMIVGAVVLKPRETALLAVVCSYLRSWFDVPGTPADLALRFIFAALSYLACGLFVAALVRNHEQTTRHLTEMRTEQARRSEAEEYLRVLAESSPAAIFTVNGAGLVVAANEAANRLFLLPPDHPLEGRSIGGYLPSRCAIPFWQAQRIGGVVYCHAVPRPPGEWRTISRSDLVLGVFDSRRKTASGDCRGFLRRNA